MYRRALLASAVSGAYAYDTLEGGAKFNRSARAGYVAFATFVEYKFVLGNVDQPLNQIHKRVAERWLWCVRQNGGLYSKLAQAVASMNHVLPPEYLETLSVIQDKAPTVSPTEVERVLFEEFGKTSSELFLEFESEAIASASVAQVHRAKLKDGTRVAVKVQKPAIAKQIDADLFMYRNLAWFLEKAFSLPIMWSIPYTCAQLRQETDFRIESENGKIAAVNIEPDLKDSITIPKIYDDFSSKRVLTCEWIDGVKVTDAKAIRSLGLDPAEVMDTVTRFFSHQLFVSGHLQ
jgi:aarF domain-containing kinase